MEPNKAPRPANQTELKQLVAHITPLYAWTREDAENVVNWAYTAVFDKYQTGYPAFPEKVMVIVYDGGPHQVEAYNWDRDGKIKCLFQYED